MANIKVCESSSDRGLLIILTDADDGYTGRNCDEVR